MRLNHLTSRANTNSEYSAMRVAVALLLSDPSLADSALSCDEIRALNKPGTKLLADMLMQIRQNPEIKTQALFEKYRNSKYEKALIQLLNWPLSLNTKTEFTHTMEHIHRLSQEQTYDQLIKKVETETLNDDDENWLQNYVSNKAD